MEDQKTQKAKIKKFWEKYEYKIVLFVGFILVAFISFEVGILQGNKLKQDAVIIEKPVEVSVPAVQGVSQSQNSTPETQKKDESVDVQPQNCAFVGSKNSNKYHLPTCRYAKSIKPENLVCFSDENEAKSKGYQPDKNCIK